MAGGDRVSSEDRVGRRLDDNAIHGVVRDFVALEVAKPAIVHINALAQPLAHLVSRTQLSAPCRAVATPRAPLAHTATLHASLTLVLLLTASANGCMPRLQGCAWGGEGVRVGR